jgi:UDP-N-acetylglucosamine--N-acetylmuramyl-(pentapeptide) pyrophosphoryl-undecaprenol N-acetylglucosamine transferase
VKVVIAGGGTAGHVFPALALAESLVAGGAEVSFIGTPTGQEAGLVPAAGFAFHPVEASAFYRELSWRAARAPVAAIRAARACRPLVAGADVVVGMGGYASAPAVIAGWRAHVGVVLHEQNAVPGLANRMLARRAGAVAVSFEGARSRFPVRVPLALTGNPVRAQIAGVLHDRDRLASEGYEQLGLDPGRSTVLILGGSLGALNIDRATAGAIPALRGRADLQLLVLTGKSHTDVVIPPEGDDLFVRTVPFLDRMELALAVADVAVARAGASSIAELTVCGVPSILVPYPYATENHQEENAREVERAGAAEVLLDANLSPQVLARRIAAFTDDPDLRKRMSERASAWSKPDAAERLAALVTEVGAG